MMQAGAIFVEVKDKKQGGSLRPLTSKDATKMVLEHIRDVPRTIERQWKAKKQCVFSGSGRVEDDLFKEGKPFDFLHEKNYETIRDMAKKKFNSLEGNAIVEEKLVGVADSKQGSKIQPPPHAKAGRMPDPPVPVFLELGKNNHRGVDPRVASVLKEAKTNKQQKGEEMIAQSKASNSKDKEIAAKDKEKEAVMKLAREEIAMLKQSIAKKEMGLEGEDAEIAKKDEKLKDKELDIARKDKQIASMKSVIRSQVKQQRGQLKQLETILDPVDLTIEDDDEPPNKRARTEEDTAKSTLAIQHESIKEAVKVKEENINDYVSFLQSKIDELASVAEAGGADKGKVAEIKGRLRLNFDEFVSATAMANMS